MKIETSSKTIAGYFLLGKQEKVTRGPEGARKRLILMLL